MKTRQLGKTGLALTELGFGGSAVGNLYRPTSREEAYSAVTTAWEAGIRYFDTAPCYGHGLSERRIGDALREFPRQSYILSTKVGRVLIPGAEVPDDEQFPQSLPFKLQYDYSYDGIMRSFEHSLQRIGTDFIDLLFMDDISQLTPDILQSLFTSGYRALTELRDQKMIRAIGLESQEWQICLDVIARIPLDCLMLGGRYTLLEHEILETCFPLCEQQNIAIIAASPYNSGVLANGQHYNNQMADQKILSRVNAIQKICDLYQIDLPHAALQFPLCHSQITSVVTGARNEEQVALSVSYLKQRIPSRLWQALKEADLIAINAPIF